MALSYVETQIEAVRAEAKTAQDSLARSVNEIDRNTTLSDEGKKLEIAATKESFKARLSTLRAKEHTILREAITTREKTLDAKMGNTSTDLIAFRDAQDRAERIDSADEAERIITRALRTDDRSLAHAIFRRSLENNWRAPINAFTQQNPDLADAANELNQLARFSENSFQRALAYAAW